MDRPGERTAPTSRTPIRVVVADDAADLRDLIVLLFEMEDDFETVAEATNGQEAVDLAREHQPDLVVLDLSMPVMDGLQALPLLRAAAPHAKIVIFSGFESAAIGREALDIGADGYIEKGTGVHELLEQLRTIVRCTEVA